MNNDDRDTPERKANTAMLQQVGQPAPSSVLAAVLLATDGKAPEHVAALPHWGEGETTWRVLGCTRDALFEVVAHKKVDEWHGGRAPHGDQETLEIRVRPLREVAGMTFELERAYGDYVGAATIYGTWVVDFASGAPFAVPHVVGRVNEALEGIVQTVRASL